MDSFGEIRKAVLTIAKRCYEDRLFTGTSGNISFFDRGLGVIGITPTGLDYTVMEEKDIVIMNIQGETAGEGRLPSSEWRLHSELYKAFPEICAVVHTHSPYASSFAVSNEEIPAILIEMVGALGGSIPVAKFAAAGTREVGLEAARVMRNRNACLLQNHGVVAIGATLESAYIRAAYTENAAKIYHLAKLNGNVVPIPDHV